MGCTHFPFIIPLIKQITEGKARVINPAPAVAHQTLHVLKERNLLNRQPKTGITRYFTTGDPARFARVLPRLIGMQAQAQALRWQGIDLTPIN